MSKQRNERSPRPRAVPTEATHLAPLKVTVLHVDDDPNDTELLRAAARKADVRFILHNAEDAEQAIAYLTGKDGYADRNAYGVPALVLLDLKMPRATGLEVLKWIRQRKESDQMPVVVLSGSELEDDIQRAYAAGANAYIVKPLEFEGLVQFVKNISEAWIAPAPKPRQSFEIGRQRLSLGSG